jgi:heptosyltransferase III
MTPRILVIRGGAIGDFVLTLPAIRLLRENFPDAHLEILGYRHIVSLAERSDLADATRSIEYSALSGFFAPKGHLVPELVAYLTSFQQIVSYLYDPDNFFEGNIRRCGVKNFLAASTRIDDSQHAAHQLARPLQSLALYLEDHAAKLEPNAEDRTFADDFLRDARRPVFAIHPGSGSETKNWPLQNWLALGDWLLTFHPQPTLLLVGGEADQINFGALRTAWKKLPIVLANNLPLHRLAAVLKKCDLFIGHDSGISHIAAAVGTPCLLLFGPTDPHIWAPANPQVRVLQSRDQTMEHLEPDTVKKAVMEMHTL